MQSEIFPRDGGATIPGVLSVPDGHVGARRRPRLDAALVPRRGELRRAGRNVREGGAQARAQHAELGVPRDVKVYPEAGHAFYTRAPGGLMGVLGALGPLHDAGYHEASAKDARTPRRRSVLRPRFRCRGQLGDGTTTDSSVPVVVLDL